jgi:Na+-driven multidrug efflux pump
MGGAGDTMWPMLIVGFSMILARIPLAYGLSARWDSAGGVWVAWTVSIVLEAMLFVLVFLWGRWKKVGRRFIETSNESN